MLYVLVGTGVLFCGNTSAGQEILRGEVDLILLVELLESRILVFNFLIPFLRITSSDSNTSIPEEFTRALILFWAVIILEFALLS